MFVEKVEQLNNYTGTTTDMIRNKIIRSNSLEQEVKPKLNPAYELNIESFYDDQNLIKNSVVLQINKDQNAEINFYNKVNEKKEKIKKVAINDFSGNAKTVLLTGDFMVSRTFELIFQRVDKKDLSLEQSNDLEKYYSIKEKIENNGKDALKSYNLMFAGIAALANYKTFEIYANRFMQEGKFSQEKYNKLNTYAENLQNKSGVFISVDFQLDDASGREIKYSYMGSLCAIGVQQLNFMADHREAEKVWIQLAQGAFNNKDEMLQALRKEGFEEIADSYMNCSEKEDTSIAFEKEDGALWDATIGYKKDAPTDKEAFKNLKIKYFGHDNVSLTYSADQLKKSFEQGKKEAKVLNEIPKMNGLDEESEADIKKKQIENVKKKIKNLNKEIKDIRNTGLSKEKIDGMVKKLEQQIETLQIQINDLLNDLADLAKE